MINTPTYLGYGRSTKALDTSIDDRNNHRGQVIRFGVNMDNARSNRDIRLQASLNGRYYFCTDDLNPSNNSTDFYLMDLSGGAVYNADGFIKPAFEASTVPTLVTIRFTRPFPS